MKDRRIDGILVVLYGYLGNLGYPKGIQGLNQFVLDNNIHRGDKNNIDWLLYVLEEVSKLNTKEAQAQLITPTVTSNGMKKPDNYVPQYVPGSVWAHKLDFLEQCVKSRKQFKHPEY